MITFVFKAVLHSLSHDSDSSIEFLLKMFTVRQKPIEQKMQLNLELNQ